MEIRNSVVAVVSAAIQNGVIISIDFLESSLMCPRLKMVPVVHQSSHDFQLLSTMLPNASVEVTTKYFLEPSKTS